jgi:hypothetical protein
VIDKSENEEGLVIKSRAKITEQTVAALEEVRLSHDGKLRPPDVVNAARPEESPLHSHFEWDDSEAAEEYRLYQARYLIRNTPRVTFDDGEPMHRYISVRVVPKIESYYTTPERLIEKPDELAQAKRDAEVGVDSAIRRLNELRRIWSLVRGDDSEDHDANMKALDVAKQGLTTASEAIKKIK